MAAGFHGFIDFPVGVAFFDRLAFVVQFFGFGKRQLYLDFTALEINFERDEVVSLFLGLADQFFDFPLVEKQFSFPHGMEAELAEGRGVGVDMKIIEPDFTPLDRGVAVHQIGLALAQGFHPRGRVARYRLPSSLRRSNCAAPFCFGR